MILIKRNIKINFDEADTKKVFGDKLEAAIGKKLLAQSDALDARLLESGKITRRKRRGGVTDGVNCYFEVIDVFKDFDTYKEVINHPINLEVRRKVELAGFRYETEIKYYSNDII